MLKLFNAQHGGGGQSFVVLMKWGKKCFIDSVYVGLTNHVSAIDPPSLLVNAMGSYNLICLVYMTKSMPQLNLLVLGTALAY